VVVFFVPYGVPLKEPGSTTAVLQNSQTASFDAVEVGCSAIRKISYRIVPFLMLCYFVAFVDRVNVGFAALQMNKDLGLSASAFGLGGALFYVTYILLEIPSNVIMERVGARLWIARIMITWGLVSAGTAFITGPNTYYLSRLLLGAAEAGFFPGVILYLTYWFPAQYRGRIIAIFMVERRMA
jgi:ACS family tartrate transporter-like MFS transporter